MGYYNVLQDRPPIYEPRKSNQREFSVSLVIPTLNEARNLPLIIPHIPMRWVDEVILVDGHSTDDTIEVAQSLLPSIKVVMQERRGKGAALQAGYQAAEGDILIVLDADGSNDPREIPRFIKALMEGADFVKGSRFAPMGGTTDMPRIRKMGNGAFVTMVNLLFDTKFTDLCYGFHAFWRHSLESIDLEGIDGFEIDTALYLRALRGRLRIVEVPSFEGYRFYGDGKLQTIPDGWRVLTTIFREWYYSLKPQKTELPKGFRGSSPAMLDDMAKIEPGFALDDSQLPFPGHNAARSALKLLHKTIQEEPENSVRQILPYLLALLIRGLRATSGSLVLLDQYGDVTYGYALYDGKVQPMENGQVAETVKHGFAGWVLENQQATIVENTLEDPRWLPRSWELNTGHGRSALGVPLVEDDQVRGVLTLARQASPFTHQDLGALDPVASSATEQDLS